MKRKTHTVRNIGLALLIFVALVYIAYPPVLTFIGEFIVLDDPPIKSDAVVVLNTGVELYPRLIQAAAIYREGFADKVVINGNRKTETLRRLERKGFRDCCPWYADSVRILVLLGVPGERVIRVSAEDAYDTVTEAESVGKQIIRAGIQSVIITTSKYHTRRAGYIWKSMFQDRLKIRTVAARSDPYSASEWWKSGRQARWVLAEYGAWLYYFWKCFKERI